MSYEIPMPEPIEIFYSYSHKDEDLRDELDTHLSVLKRQGLISAWHDRCISAGTEWAGKIDEHLESAQVILLLISNYFMASDYCWDVELKRAMERHEARQARVIPIILRPVDMKGAPFAKLQALPKDAKPVTKWSDRDEAFLDIAKGIRRVVESLQTGGTTPKPAPVAPLSGLSAMSGSGSSAVNAGAGNAAPPVSAPKVSEDVSRALATWKRKLEMLRTEEAKAFDPSAKFKIQEDIEEAKAKIREYGG